MTRELFGDLSAAEVHLAHAPLTKTLAQIRFPSAPALGMKSGQLELSQALRSEYPVAREQAGIELILGPQGVTQQQSSNKIYQLKSKDGAWQVSYSDGFVALETGRYDSRQDFCERLLRVLNAVNAVAEPVLVDRTGIRYINQIKGESLKSIGSLLEPAALGGWLLGQKTAQGNLAHTVSESLFSHEGKNLLIRSGKIPARVSTEPTVPVMDEETWLLDLDSYSESSGDFDTPDIVRQVHTLADVAYSAFRSLVTDRFLRHFNEE